MKQKLAQLRTFFIYRIALIPAAEALCLDPQGSKESVKSRDFTGKGIVMGDLSGNLWRQLKGMLYLSSSTESDYKRPILSYL